MLSGCKPVDGGPLLVQACLRVTWIGVAAWLSLAPPIVAASPKPKSMAWADLEPIALSCFVIQHDESGRTWPDIGKPAREGGNEKVLRAISDACEQAGPHLAWSMTEAQQAGVSDTESLRHAMASSPRVVRVLKRFVELGMKDRHIACADCTDDSEQLKDVTAADLMRHAVAFAYVAPGDFEDRDNIHFHTCVGSNAAGAIDRPDPVLLEVAFSAMYATLPMEPQLIAAIKKNILAASLGAIRGERVDLEKLNATLREGLMNDDTFRATMLPALARDARLSGLRCTDCLPPPAETSVKATSRTSHPR